MNENIFEKRALPRYFAVLRPTSGGGPSFQFCEIEYREPDVSIVFNAHIPVETLHSLPMRMIPIEERDSSIYEYRMRNVLQNDEDIRKVKYWHTPYSFFWNEYTIPVLDFNKRFFLTRSFVRIIPLGMSQLEITQIGMDYLSLRSRCMLQIPVVHGRTTEGFCRRRHEIPSFVMELLYKDVVARNESCPILATPFQELRSIAVTPCYHLFEYNALTRWLETHDKCPLCRAPTAYCERYEHHPEHLQNVN